MAEDKEKEKEIIEGWQRVAGAINRGECKFKLTPEEKARFIMMQAAHEAAKVRAFVLPH